MSYHYVNVVTMSIRYALDNIYVNKLITKYQDVIDEIHVTPKPSSQTLIAKPIANRLDQEHQLLLECVNFSATGIEMIQGRSNFSGAKMCCMLAFLELQGYLKQIPGQGYARIK